MTSTTTDRLAGVSSGLGMKAPVRVATTANITLSGLQTIDGVTVVADDRVLVKDQTDTTTNGIYAASSGVWVRSKDFDGSRDIVQGTCVIVSNGTDFGNTFWKVTTANPVIGSALVFGRITSQVEDEVTASDTVAAAYADTKHADSYASLEDAINDLENYDRLLLKGGHTYTFSGGTFATWPDYFVVDSDNGLPWVIDFSGNSAWYPSGLINQTSALVASTEEDLTADITAASDSVQASSATAVGQLVTMNATGHGFVTGDEIFIRYGGSASAGQAAYCTERDSDEGQALDRPVTVTRITDNQFTYTAYSGTPDATMTIFPYVYKNNQVVKVASSADYAVGDLVFIETDATFQSFTGTQTIAYAELNEVGRIVDGTRLWLRLPVEFSYNVADNAKITKVTKKRPVFMNGKIIGNDVNTGKTLYTQSDIGILFHLCYRPLLVNIEFEKCDFVGNWMRSCFFPMLINCRDTKPMEDSAGRVTGKIEVQYGFAYGNATRGYLAIDCEAKGGRHGFDEYSTGSYKGLLIDWTLVRPRAYDQWSTNIDTHGMNFGGRIIDPIIRGGDGIACRNGSIICTGIRAYGSLRAFIAYGRAVQIVVSVDDADMILSDVVSISPSSDIATPTPDSTGIKVLHVNSKNCGGMGVRIQSPASHKFISPYIGPIQCDGVRYYALYMATGSGAEIVNPYVVSVTSNDFGSRVAYLGNVSGGYFGGIFGRKTGSFTVCQLSDAAATGNTFNNVGGVSTSGGTVTKFSVPAACVGNFTNSLDYESKTIASGAVTKNWRNVPMLIVDTEGAAASDDLDRIDGLSYGDTCFIQSANSARDIVVKDSTYNIRMGRHRTLRTTSEVLHLMASGSYLYTSDFGSVLYGSATYDPANLADGAGVTTTVTVTGAELGDYASATFSNALQGILMTAWVSAADTVSVRFQNETTGTIDLASGTLRARVEKAT